MRKATMDDLDRIVEIEQTIFGAEHFCFSRRNYINFIKKGFCVVAIVDGIIVGTGVNFIVKTRDKKFYSRIYSLCVLKEYRKQGLGSNLIEFMEKLGKGCKFYSLETHKSHHDVIKLYERHGYSIVSELKNYYGEEDGVRMRKYD